jgi:hypothetical protein
MFNPLTIPILIDAKIGVYFNDILVTILAGILAMAFLWGFDWLMWKWLIPRSTKNGTKNPAKRYHAPIDNGGGSLAEELWQQGKSDEEIAERIKQKFGG